MDLLCTEVICTDTTFDFIYDEPLQLHQQQRHKLEQSSQLQQQIPKQPTQTNQQQQQHTKVCSSAPSPYTSNSSSSCSSSSSGYISNGSNISTKYNDDSNNSNNNNTTKVNIKIVAQNHNHNKYHDHQHHHQLQEQSVQPTLTAEQQRNNAYQRQRMNKSLDHVNTATEDPTFLTDRCLENALKAEEKRPHIVCTYFKTVQKDITPPMRKIVAEWMMEVCAEEKCQEEVVLLALNYMDRFLSLKSVRKTHLQILAAACLLLASKLREPSCRALSAELLVFYTDNSIYKSDLIKWELFVLSRLGWDLSSVTPLDFLELLLIRLPIKSVDCPDLSIDKVRQHAQAFISLAAKEHQFSVYSASTIAASSIAAALNGLNWHLRTGQNMRYLLNLLTDLTSVEQDYLHDCMMKMESMFEEHSRNLQPYLVSVDTIQQQHSQSQQQLHSSYHQHQIQPLSQKHHHRHHSSSHYSQHHGIALSGNASVTIGVLPDLTQTCKMQANAQKDVQDIKF